MFSKTNLLSRLFLISLIILLGCQQEDDINTQIIEAQQSSKSITKTVTAKDIPHVISFLESKSNSQLQFLIDDRNNPDYAHRNHEENLTITEAMSDEITMVTNTYGKSNYTFPLTEVEEKEGVYFLNLVVKEFKDSFYILISKYVPTLDWLNSYTDYSDFATFSGTIYFYDDEGIYVGKSDINNGSSTGFETRDCGNGSGDGNSGGGPSGDGNEGDPGGNDGVGGGITCYVSVSWYECGGDNSSTPHPGNTPDNSDNCGGDGGGSGWIISWECFEDKSMYDVVDCPDATDSCHDSVGDPCACNAEGTGCADDGENENPDVGINISVIDCEIFGGIDTEASCVVVLIFEQDYKTMMTPTELAIFEDMSRLNQLIYLNAAHQATEISKIHFPNSQYNGKGDAFRHAYWNAQGAIGLGDQLMSDLTTAHENHPPTYAYSHLENQMDLHNNAEGISRKGFLSDGYSSLEESILDAVNTGALVYINNLASNGQATGSSQIIPTNQ